MSAQSVVAFISLLLFADGACASEFQSATPAGDSASRPMTASGTIIVREVPPFISGLMGSQWISFGVEEVGSRARSRMYMQYTGEGQPMPRVGQVCKFNLHIEAIEGIVGDGGSEKIAEALVLDSFKCHARTKKKMSPAKNGDAGS